MGTWTDRMRLAGVGLRHLIRWTQCRRSPRFTADDWATIRSRLADGGAILVDVREADERANETVPGSLSVPLSRLGGRIDATILPEHAAKAIVYCHCGHGVRALMAAERLTEAGYDARAVRDGPTAIRNLLAVHPTEPHNAIP